jgi:ubiquinone/menaquinone biosynthesis C-methylase UbiE
MGYFSLPLARLVGSKGKVVCVDLQEKMLKTLIKRARKAGLADRIETRVCPEDSLCLDNLKETIDFALAFAVVHEVPDAEAFFSETFQCIKPGGSLLLAEPKGHVTKPKFEETISLAEGKGFGQSGRPKIRSSHAVLLQKHVAGG